MNLVLGGNVMKDDLYVRYSIVNASLEIKAIKNRVLNITDS